MHMINNTETELHTNINMCIHVYITPGTPASSTTKTGRHDIAEILLKVTINTKIQIQIRTLTCVVCVYIYTGLI
jgi:hypothetical protein